MRQIGFVICVVLATFLCFPSSQVFAQQGVLPPPTVPRGKVFSCVVAKNTDIYDGDNVRCLARIGRVTKRWNLRLVGIDAPEIRGHQPFAVEARNSLRLLTVGREVTIELLGRDTVWKRHLVRARVGNADIGLELARQGFGWYRAQYALSLTDDEKVKYSAAFEEARSQKRGLWAGDKPIAPWTWRRSSRRIF